MLETLRKGAQTWVAKLLMIVLIVSFGVWGASSALMSGNSDVVVRVGSETVSANEFRLAYQRQLNQMQNQFGRRLTGEEARMLGADQQVYAQLVAGASLDQLADNMNLGLSEDRLADLIAQDPAFQNANGRFDRQRFQQLLRNVGMNEDDYVAERSKVAVRGQIVDGMADGFEAPETLMDAIREYRSQSRVVDYIVLSNAFIDPIKTPGDDVLKPWFEQRQAAYRAPEYRKFSYVTLNPADIADPGSVADSAVRDDYEARVANYTTPEQRTIQQLTFTNQADAEAAAQALKDGTKTFDQLLADQGKTSADVSLGTYAKGQFPDQTIDDAAFSIAESGGTSGVVQGNFGPVIIRVTAIEPESVRPFDEVKDQIRQELAERQAADDILNVEDQYEDQRAGGATMADAAQSLGLKAVTVDAVDANGRDMDGNPVEDLPLGTQLVSAVFDSETGVENLPLNLDDGGVVWYEVEDVTAARDRTFDEVSSQVAADWAAERQRQALAEKADEVKKRVEDGATLQEIAEEFAIPVETSPSITRASQNDSLGPEAIAAAFSGPLGTVATAPLSSGSEQVVLKVASVTNPTGTLTTSGDEQAISAIAKSAGDDILDEMINKLQSEYGVSINQTLAQQAINLQ
ncbi:SurA N-terminal domain-containing protein [Martelella endophytica]|uniref:Parvulin-like PPIase n=1 Tax=Martelella endophytica TaxID=1486262 RepID=A0A0D5LSM3_MAREN|nr:SurA N-terminal domain-containing protein [Martelella endophytica]AJY46945.1 peptidylprolyl isomerase [Martelella endophytica]